MDAQLGICEGWCGMNVLSLSSLRIMYDSSIGYNVISTLIGHTPSSAMPNRIQNTRKQVHRDDVNSGCRNKINIVFEP
jgi:hypothetical protein